MSDITAILREAHAHYGRGDLPGAAATLERARRDGAEAPALTHMVGVVAYAQGRLNDAIAAFEEALAASPGQPDWLGHLAQAYRQTGRADAALTTIDRALALSPLDGNLMATKAQCLRASGAKEEALVWYRKALAAAPGEASTLWNMANLLVDMGRAREGRTVFEGLAEALPGDAEVWNNLAFAAYEDADPEASLAACDHCLAMAPDHAEAHLNRAHALLSLGRYAEGWPEYEWRKTRTGLDRRFDCPQWDGGDVRGKTVLLHAEQGLGDALQFVRFAPLLKERGATVMLEAPKALSGLLKGAVGVDRMIGPGEGQGADLHCPLPSLPLALDVVAPEDFARGPYLQADPERRQAWVERLRQAGGLRPGRLTVGLAWQGNPGHPRDHLRSVPVGALADLSAAEGVDFVNLQSADSVTERPGLPLIDFGADLDRDAPFVDTAALMCELDLVVAVDSAVHHLAGALGAETWLLLSHAPDWRWGMTGARSPWYPKARLFRQAAERDWNGVMVDVVTALNERP